MRMQTRLSIRCSASGDNVAHVFSRRNKKMSQSFVRLKISTKGFRLLYDGFPFVFFFFFLINGFGRVQAPTYPVLMTTLYYLRFLIVHARTHTQRQDDRCSVKIKT